MLLSISIVSFIVALELLCSRLQLSFFRRLNAFLEGFYDIIPKRLISIFNEQELELLISGLPNVDIEDLKANTEYHKYTATSLQVYLHIFSRTLFKLILISGKLSCMIFIVDSMVLACTARFRSSRSREILAIRYRYVEGTPTRFCCVRRHERRAKVSNSQRG